MDFPMFVGFIVGNIFGLIATAAAITANRRKGHVDSDERTALINARSGSAAFRAVALFAYAGWIVDNIQAYQQGGPVRFFSSWSAVLGICFVTRVAAAAYYHWQMSADDPEERASKPVITALLLGILANALLFSTIEAAELRVVLSAVELLLLGALGWAAAPLINKVLHAKQP